LERTNRYLTACQVTAQIKDHRDNTLHDLVCIMANAPMITTGDIDSADSTDPRTPSGDRKKPTARATMT
jgi:hypothetical protein